MRTLDVLQFDAAVKDKPLSLKHARREIAVLGGGGSNFTPLMDYIDQHRDYDGLIIFTDGHPPVPPKPQNRATRVLWLFNNQSNYALMSKALHPIGLAALLRDK